MIKQQSIEKQETAQLGFWIYLMTDMMMFAALFATFWVLREGVNGGPSGSDLFDPHYALVETIILLTSSVTVGLSNLALQFGRVKQSFRLLAVTILLGVGFLSMELVEFIRMAGDGHGPNTSAFLSGFFTLVGTHGFHILVGLIWATVLICLLRQRHNNVNFVRKFGLFTLFWHFLDLVWIFIFSVVYLIGGLA